MPQLKEAKDKRPNTGVPDRFLQSDLIVCVGEDSRELMQCVRLVLPTEKPRHHHYRCFHFWKYSKFTLALTGIGTGSLEPLIYEMAISQRVRRIILIGTAGIVGPSTDKAGQVYVIDEAFLAGAGVHAVDIMEPIKPSFAGVERLNLPRKAGIASDYYYALGNSTDLRILAAQNEDPALKEARAKVVTEGRLVDMETPQFYKLCRWYGLGVLDFVAIRGPANSIGVWQEQTHNAESVLINAFEQAVRLFNCSPLKAL